MNIGGGYCKRYLAVHIVKGWLKKASLSNTRCKQYYLRSKASSQETTDTIILHPPLNNPFCVTPHIRTTGIPPVALAGGGGLRELI